MQEAQETDLTGQENSSISQEHSSIEPEKSKIERVKELLANNQPIDDDLVAEGLIPEPETQPEAEVQKDDERTDVSDSDSPDSPLPDPETPLKLSDVAEKLGIEAKSLYDIEIPIGGDEVLSLGALKDAFKDKATAEQEVATKAAALDMREAALSSDIAALGVLDAMQQIPQPIQQQANAWLMQRAEEEYNKFLALTPELKDDAVRIPYETEAKAVLAKYDIIPEQLGVRTAGMHRFVRDAVKAFKLFEKLAQPEAKEPPKAAKRSRYKAPPRSELDQLAARARETGNRKDRVAAVSALLKGG